MVFVAVLFLLGIYLLFAGGLTLLHKLANELRYRATVKAWVGGFVLEILLLVFVEEHYVPQLKLTIHNSLHYIVALTVEIRQVLPGLFRGKDPDIALLLLLPLLPALLGFWFDRRRLRALRYVCNTVGIHLPNGECLARWSEITRVEAAKVVAWQQSTAPTYTYYLFVHARGTVLRTNSSRENEAGYAEVQRGLQHYLPTFCPDWQQGVDHRFAQRRGWNEVFATCYYKDKVVIYPRA